MRYTTFNLDGLIAEIVAMLFYLNTSHFQKVLLFMPLTSAYRMVFLIKYTSLLAKPPLAPLLKSNEIVGSDFSREATRLHKLLATIKHNSLLVPLTLSISWEFGIFG